MKYRAWNSGTIRMCFEMPDGIACYRFTKAYARDAATNRMWFPKRR